MRNYLWDDTKDTILIQSKIRHPWPKTVHSQQDLLGQVLKNLRIPFKRYWDVIEVSVYDYLGLRLFGVAEPIRYKRKKTELAKPVLVSVLKKNRQPGQKISLPVEFLIERLERVGIFYSVPEDESLLEECLLWIQSDDCQRFYEKNFDGYGDHVCQTFPPKR
ncbi:MAG: hypothetical protein KIH89_000280 [Candidatus Shapirobacteria bacterium]|nr:hypothetical protein [Candidatus Shapirobacteria bacterium]